MIDTFDISFYFKGYSREYYNISRVAVKRFIEWHKENPDFYGYNIVDHESLVSN